MSKNNNCPYCQGESSQFVPLNQSVEYSCIELMLNPQGMLRVRTYKTYPANVFESQDVVELKYCPNCGKPFKKFQAK